MISYQIILYNFINNKISMLPNDQLRLVISLVAIVPISYSLSFIKNPKLFIILSVVITTLLQLYVFGHQCIILWLQQQIVYFTCKYGPRKKIGKVIFVESFIYLAIIMWRRMYYSYGSQNVDITSALMMQIFCYIGFGYNYQDGIDKNKFNSERTIYVFPKYSQYIGYVFFVPSCLVGPAFQFQDYINYINRKAQYQKLKSSIPGILKQAKIFILCLLCYGLTIPFPLSKVLTEQYAHSSFVYQFIYLSIMIIGQRFKYYSVWSLGMIGVNATGITYNPKSDEKQNQWDRIVVSNIKQFELDPSIKKKAQAWNMPIQIALRRYIYDRVADFPDDIDPKIKRKLQNKAQACTLFTSALWHGFYPGYFVSFFHWMLALQINQQLFRIAKENKFFQTWKNKLNWVQMIFSNFYIGYFGTCFLLMTGQKILVFFSAAYYIPVIGLYFLNGLIVKSNIFKRKKPKSQQNINQTKTE